MLLLESYIESGLNLSCALKEVFITTMLKCIYYYIEFVLNKSSSIIQSNTFVIGYKMSE